MKRQLFISLPLVCLALIVLSGCANESGPPPEKPSFFASEQHTSTSQVVSVDPAARMITLREEGDEPETYKVGKDVRNLEQVRAGDMVAVDYYEATSIKVLPPGAPINEASTAMDRSKPGEKPGGMAARKTTRTVEVASVFPASSEVVTRNSAGKLRTWKVKDAKKLENINSGDRVQLTYTELLAVRVSPAPKPTTAPIR